VEPGRERVERTSEPSRGRVLEGSPLVLGGKLLEERGGALAWDRQRIGESACERDQVGLPEDCEDGGDPFTDIPACPRRKKPIPTWRFAHDCHMTDYRRARSISRVNEERSGS